jgi:hypothetical protein
MGDRPQEIINRQVLANADLLVAIFWTRIGTPTGESASGTIEEIEKHMELGKPTMIYFSETPVVPNSIVPAQYEALQRFKVRYRSEGLIETFESSSSFREIFSRQLAQTIIRSFPADASHDGSPLLATGETEFEMMERLSIPSLSKNAQELLCEISEDKHAHVLVLRANQGTIIKANNRDFSAVGDPRSEAEWTAAVEELGEHGLIRDNRGMGEVFSMTERGFEVADVLKERRD